MLHYSGARRNLVIIRNNTISELLGNKYPIAGWQIDPIRAYTPHRIKIEPGDALYLYSDGYSDQFGGPKGKKFGKKRLHQLLTELSDLPMSQQFTELETAFADWKQELEQIDDVSIVAVRL